MTEAVPESLKSHLLGMGAEIFQKFKPIKKICNHFVGVHGYAEDARQVLAHHFCSHLNEEIYQCIIYDSNDEHAKLIGIEYVISDRIFERLDDEEKKLWHSHVYEIKSGLLACPLLPDTLEHKVMADLINTYGKTIHTWQYDKYDLPLGPPKLMMSAVKDSDPTKEMIEKRNEAVGVSMERSARSRADINPKKDPSPMADYWNTHARIPCFDIVHREISKSTE